MKEALMRTHVRLAAAVLAVAIFGCLRAAAQEPAPELTIIEFTKGQELSAFLDGAAAIVGRPLLYDPNNQRIRGQPMSTGMSWAVPKGRELDLIRSILAFHEIVLIPSGPKGYEVLLAVDSRSTNMFVKNKAEFVPYERLAEYEDKDGVFITTSIPVRHVDNLTTLRTALSTMVTPAGIGRVHEVPGTRRLVVMDFAPSVVAMARVVRELDREPEPVLTETIPLNHAEAVALAVTLRELFVRPMPATARPQLRHEATPQPRIAAYEPANKIVIVATEEDRARIKEVVKQLDQPVASE
ncbi:MAG: secretin N-terminal domain-containing protein [Planctomycetota bacterium]|jgi:type II secretory pathway component GspD/PulD (secretin)